MKAGKSWCLAGLMTALGLASASCGKDEGLGGGGGIVGGDGSGGTSSTAGTTGRGGSSSTAGSGGLGTGGTAPGASPTKLGRACMANADCSDPMAPGLTCVTGSVGDGSPPGGFCTIECDPAAQGTECEEVGPGSLCYPFSDSKAYCIEACVFGEPDVGEAKCHNRDDFACNPALLGDTEEACEATADCQTGELCDGGTCKVVFPGCLPSCRGDIDCATGTYCDQSFLGGLCVDEKPTGKALGEPCTVPAANEPDEPDECLGFCQADGPDTDQGHCATNCGLLKECAWNSDTEKFDGLCVYPSILDPDGGAGDFGFCMPACNCTDECQDASLTCTTDLIALPSPFKGAGLCVPSSEEPAPYNQCTDNGGGGAGGGGAGGAGAGGEAAAGGAGAAGAPSDPSFSGAGPAEGGAGG